MKNRIRGVSVLKWASGIYKMPLHCLFRLYADVGCIRTPSMCFQNQSLSCQHIMNIILCYPMSSLDIFSNNPISLKYIYASVACSVHWVINTVIFITSYFINLEYSNNINISAPRRVRETSLVLIRSPVNINNCMLYCKPHSIALKFNCNLSILETVDC